MDRENWILILFSTICVLRIFRMVMLISMGFLTFSPGVVGAT